MKRFLKKIFFFAIPIFLSFLFAECLLRRIPNDYSLKFSTYKEHAGEFETLILGNSYALYDLNPAFFDTKTFNGAHLAQSLDLDDAIFHKFESKLTNLKYVVIPISDMSFFLKLGNFDATSWRMINYSIYYKLYNSNRISDYVELLNLPFSINRYRLISYYWNNKSNITIDSNGFGTDYKFIYRHNLDTSAVSIKKQHEIKDFTNFQEERNSLEQIIKTCYKKNIKVILLVPPAYRVYAAAIDSTQLAITLRTCDFFKGKYKNVWYSSFLNDTSFNTNDYFDAVHLNEVGAKKLSLRVNEIIMDLRNNFNTYYFKDNLLSIYFPNTSNSRFTISFTFNVFISVCSNVTISFTFNVFISVCSNV